MKYVVTGMIIRTIYVQDLSSGTLLKIDRKVVLYVVKNLFLSFAGAWRARAGSGLAEFFSKDPYVASRSDTERLM